MQDKIGVALGLNRLGVNCFNVGRVEKSVSFHTKNLQFSDGENSFVGFYNLGICYRSLKEYEESLKYFKTAYEWACEYKVIKAIFFTLYELGY